MEYTAGELAKLLGVSSRTIRFYDEKQILKPSGYTQAGYRLYDADSVQKLQKIMMLRFLNFSLDQIYEMMRQEEFDIRNSLKEQELLLIDKKEHILRMLDAVRKAQQSSDEMLWDNLLSIMEMTKHRESVVTQYATDHNLQVRIDIHKYSTAKENFYDWLLEENEITENMRILEIGCGNAMFWLHTAKNLPNGLEVHLTDYSDGMLQAAKENIEKIMEQYPEKHLTFILDKRDATDFSYPVKGFDRIMANHMLFHLSKESRKQLYPKIQSLLAPQGRLCCTFIGKNHMKEMHDLLEKFYPGVEYPSMNFDIYLETAEEELKEYFYVIKNKEHENDLLVPDEEMIWQYIASYSGEVKNMNQKEKEQFLQKVQTMKDTDGNVFVHKSTGNIVLAAK